EHFIQTAEYKNLTPGPEGGRALMLKKKAEDYKALAQAEMRKQFPELDEMILGEQIRKIKAIRGY
ncbi:hypothetical protein, partial [Candidatus Magnetobacterium casense]|uniref:hypothetical protein n=1 Tax=Candidatus Magnetobacterium casense TaxID=1455061 RepID=UPI001C476D67